MEKEMKTACLLDGNRYNKHCAHCMVRLIIDARSPTAPKVAAMAQRQHFAYMGEAMATRVKKLLTTGATVP